MVGRKQNGGVREPFPDALASLEHFVLVFEGGDAGGDGSVGWEGG